MSKQNNDNEYCHGCIEYINFRETITCLNYNHDKSCPCMPCIVKMICENYCPAWKKWKEEARGNI